jgi:hypothetical protein
VVADGESFGGKSDRAAATKPKKERADVMAWRQELAGESTPWLKAQLKEEIGDH